MLHELLVIGEAAKRLSPEFRREHPQVPWKSVAGMRDQLIHAYDAVDLEEVWKTLNCDIPQLLAFLEPLLPESTDRGPGTFAGARLRRQRVG